MPWLELLHQAPGIIHHVAIHHHTVTTVAIDHHIAASLLHQDPVVAALELTQKAMPQGIFTEEEVEQFIALVLAGTVTALVSETAINLRKTLSAQMRNQMIDAVANRLARLQAEHENIGARVTNLVKRNHTRKAEPDFNRLVRLEKSIEILSKLKEFLNTDFSAQSPKVAIQANDW